MGFLIKIHSTWCFLPTYDHIRGFSVLKAHFTGVREKLDIWAKSSLFTSTPEELSLPKPLPQTALIHWPHPRKALAQSPNLLFKFLVTFEFQSSKYTRKSSVLSPHLPRKPWSPFSQSLRLLSYDPFLRIYRNHSGLVTRVSLCMSKRKTENKEML